MLFITLSALLMGPEEKLFSVLSIEENIPFEKEDRPKEEPKFPKEDNFKEPPRFIPDEPLNLDPSAVEKTEEDEQSDGEIRIPDERDAKKAASPYVMEIINIKENAYANIASLEKKIAIDYLSLPKEERDDAPEKLKEKYMPRINLILQTADKDVDRALKKMEGALKAINADLTLVEEAKKSYLDEKEEKINYYKEILKSLGQDMDLSALLDS